MSEAPQPIHIYPDTLDFEPLGLDPEAFRSPLTGPSGLPKAFGPTEHVFLPEGTACAWAFGDGTVAIIVDVTAS